MLLSNSSLNLLRSLEEMLEEYQNNLVNH